MRAGAKAKEGRLGGGLSSAITNNVSSAHRFAPFRRSLLTAARSSPSLLIDPLYFHTLPIKTLGRNPSDPLSSSFHTWLTSLTTTHNVSLAFSYYESSNGSLYNTLALYSPSRSPVQYRKTHIPDGPGYCEKFYFTPGDTGPVVAELPSGLKVGLSVCWDQVRRATLLGLGRPCRNNPAAKRYLSTPPPPPKWFPEQARSLALLGAHVLIYPTAIGSEPHTGICSSSSSLGQWRRVMQGHAAANMIPVMAVNRAGVERVMGEGGRTSEVRAGDEHQSHDRTNRE